MSERNARMRLVTRLTTHMFEQIPRELACPLEEEVLCGRLVIEKERYQGLSLKLESLEKEREKYRTYFETILNIVKSQISTPLLIKDILKSNLSNVKAIHSGYFFFTEQRLDFWIFLEDQDWAAEDAIYECYGELLNQFPEKEIDLRVIRLWGREPGVLIPEGFQHW